MTRDTTPRVSLVIPAHNEEALLPATLDALRAAAESSGRTWELIVVDDASTDSTAAVASAAGARVVPVEKRKISAVRNAGALVARGEQLVFVDADTIVPPETLRAALDAMDDGAVGGGVRVTFDRKMPFWVRLPVWLLLFAFRIIRLAAGCCFFCRRADFDAAGGWDESVYAAEERYLSEALNRRGRFVMLRENVVTSGRKLHLYPTWTVVWLIVRYMVRPRHTLEQPHDLWYDGRREAAPPERS